MLVKLPRGVENPLDIARLEWDAGVIPIDIKKEERVTETDNAEK